MTSELKPCPFCGSQAETLRIYAGECFVKCSSQDCSVQSSACGWGATDAEAAAKWNRREPFGDSEQLPQAELSDWDISQIYVKWNKKKGASFADLMRAAISASRALRAQPESLIEAQAELSDEAAALVRSLRSFGDAYPTDMFSPLTEAERLVHSRIITRASASMGRHYAKFMLQAADMIESLAADRALRAPTHREWCSVCENFRDPHCKTCGQDSHAQTKYKP